MNEEILDQLQEQTIQPEPQEVVAPIESKKEQQFKQLRERAERAEQRANDLERVAAQRQQSVAPAADEDDLGVDDDLYVEGKQFKRNFKTIKQELKQTREQMEMMNNQATEIRLRSKYNDFDKVVTQDNLRLLMEKKAPQYRALMAAQDLYDKGETAYEMIKSWIVEPDYSDADNRIAANKSKPRTATTATTAESSSPLAKFSDSDRFVMNDSERMLVLDRLAAIKRR